MIHIEDDYYIDADKYCYSLVQRRIAGDDAKEPGKEYYSPLNSYHSTISDCLRAYVTFKQRKQVSEHDQNLQEAILAFKRIDEQVMHLLDGLIKEGEDEHI